MLDIRYLTNEGESSLCRFPETFHLVDGGRDDLLHTLLAVQRDQEHAEPQRSKLEQVHYLVQVFLSERASDRGLLFGSQREHRIDSRCANALMGSLPRWLALLDGSHSLPIATARGARFR